MSYCSASCTSVRSPLIAAIATFALKADVWFRRGLLLMLSPDSRANLVRCQAEAPLIALCRFPKPALTIKYSKRENIGLVPEDAKGDLGMFLLDPAGGGSEQDTVFSDGPIIYGTGMSDADRQKAWKHFFMLMVKAVVSQQGKGVLGVKLARRCMPDQDFCTTALDAYLVGIGGIKEPRKVLVIVTTDLRDQNKQLSRIVCTRPTKDKQVCREFDTGKLVTDDTGQ